MEIEKYYVPAIEEFHVGFEFEYQEIEYAQWIKDSFILNWSREDSSIDHYLDFGNIRVKYLDREDIESFGFKFNNESDVFNQSYYSLITDFKGQRRMIKFTHGINDTDNYISTHVVGCADSTIFLGKIKNKSEFRRILQQLLII